LTEDDVIGLGDFGVKEASGSQGNEDSQKRAERMRGAGRLGESVRDGSSVAAPDFPHTETSMDGFEHIHEKSRERVESLIPAVAVGLKIDFDVRNGVDEGPQAGVGIGQEGAAGNDEQPSGIPSAASD